MILIGHSYGGMVATGSPTARAIVSTNSSTWTPLHHRTAKAPLGLSHFLRRTGVRFAGKCFDYRRRQFRLIILPLCRAWTFFSFGCCTRLACSCFVLYSRRELRRRTRAMAFAPASAGLHCGDLPPPCSGASGGSTGRTGNTGVAMRDSRPPNCFELVFSISYASQRLQTMGAISNGVELGTNELMALRFVSRRRHVGRICACLRRSAPSHALVVARWNVALEHHLEKRTPVARGYVLRSSTISKNEPPLHRLSVALEQHFAKRTSAIMRECGAAATFGKTNLASSRTHVALKPHFAN